MKEIKIGVVGIGPHFRETLLPSLVSQEGVVLSAFCDLSKDARRWVSTRFSQSIVTSDVKDSLFWNAVDCVVCCSWPKAHEEVLRKAIMHHKHCFCEKPVASSVKRLDGILKASIPHDLVMRVGHVFRYAGGGFRFIDALREKNIECLEVSYVGSGPRGRRWNIPSRKAFGLTHLTHAIDFIVASSGRVLSVKGIHWSSKQLTESVLATFETERCPLVVLMATNAATAFTCKATAVLENGASVTLDSLRSVTMTGVSKETKRSGDIWMERDLGTQVQNDGYAGELHDFFREIRGAGICRLPDLFEAGEVLSVVEKVVR